MAQFNWWLHNYLFDSNSDTSNKIEAIGNGKGVPFDCTVDPSFVGYVSDSSPVHML